MTLYLITFSFFLVGTGAYRLFNYFQMIGSVTSVGEILNSTVLTATFGLVIGFGLIFRKSWGRLGAMGICFVGTLAPIAGGIYVALNFRTYLMAFGFVLIFLQNLPVFLNNIYSYLALGILATALSSALFLIGLLQLRTERAKEYYNDTLWLGRPFTFQGHDLRPLFMALLFLFVTSIDKLTPDKFRRQVDEKKFVQATKDLKVELEKDPQYIKQQQLLAAQKLAEQEDKRRFEYVAFTNDEAKIWAVSKDQQVHLIDLYKYKTQSFAFGDFHRDRIVHLSADGLYFYNSDKNTFIETSSNKEIPLAGAKSIVLGFAEPSTQVLLLRQNTGQLELYDFISQKIIWSKPWINPSNQPFLNGYFWSADRKMILLAPSEGFFLLNILDGNFQKAEFKFRYPEYQSSNTKTHQMVVSGPADFSQMNFKTYLIETETQRWSEINTADPIVDFDPLDRTYITRQNIQIRLRSMASPQNIEKELTLSYNEIFLKAAGSPWAMTIRTQADRAQFLNLKTDQVLALGQTYTSSLVFNPNTTKTAVSPTGLMWVVTNRNKIEVFWTSQFTQASPRSWAFEISIHVK